ncbi:MAG: AMP-binding protein [Candidatus Rariloculaceae bacterium]
MKQSVVAGESDMPLLEATIDRVFVDTVMRQGDSEALIVPHQNIRWTWRDLDERVEGFSRGLITLGFRPGDRLGIWATNRWEWVVTQFAAARIGVILVSINPAYRLGEVDYALNKVGCRGLITGVHFKTSNYIAMLNELMPELAGSEPGETQAERVPALTTVIRLGDDTSPGMFNYNDILSTGSGIEDPSPKEISEGLSNTDAVNIQFTSGTTGSPKGATLTHRNILNNARFMAKAMRLKADDRICVPVPMYHCFGQVAAVLVSANSGAAVVFPAEAFDPGSTLEAIAAERCTTLLGVPTMFLTMLDHPAFATTDVSSLRTGIMAGSPCPMELMKQTVSTFHLPEITIAYGMTETSPVSFQSQTDDPVDKRCGTVGRVAPHAEAKIVDSDGNIVARGEQGEVLARGYMVMQGYWDDPERTAEAIDEDGWMHTGDLGTLDEEGWLRINGRVKDMIIRAGENVYPREIEELLYLHPKVLEVQVFGVPDRKMGEEVAAWIQLREGESATTEEIKAYCRGEIAHFKIPNHIRFVTAFPMTVTGKIQKFEMSKALAAELGLESGTA